MVIEASLYPIQVSDYRRSWSRDSATVVSSGSSPLDWQLTLGHRHLALPLYTLHICIYTPTLYTHFIPTFMLHTHTFHLCTHVLSLYTSSTSIHTFHSVHNSISVHTLHLCTHTPSLGTRCISVHTLHLCTYALYLFFCVQFPLHIRTHNDWRAFILNASFYLHHLLRDSPIQSFSGLRLQHKDSILW